MIDFLATYQDKRGSETIQIQSDGSDMSFTLRGIDFEGHDFDQLTANQIDNTKFDYEMFQDGSGDLTNFKITVTIPIPFYNALSNQTFTENLITYIEVGETTTIEGLDSEINSLTLNTSFGEFKVDKKLEWMEDALIALQKQLPENIYLQTCLSCKNSNYSPFGNGMFGNIYCFKNIKEKLTQLNDKTDLLDIWTAEAVEKGDIFSVQETYACNKHQILTEKDWTYKSWTKYLPIDENKERCLSSLFYQKLNTLLHNQLSEIKETITSEHKQILQKKKHKHPLPLICQFEHSSYGSNRQWCLKLDFDNYQWSNQTVKPHFLSAIINLDTGKEFIHFKYKLCSSFNDTLKSREIEKIPLESCNDLYFVSKKIKEVVQFLEKLPQHFIKEIEKINFEELEYVEDMEEIYQIINLHKTNDTEAFYARTQLLLFDAIELMNEYINDYEQTILNHVKEMFSGKIPISTETLKNLRIIVAKKKISETEIKKERMYVLNAINGFLIPFEDYNENDEIERPHDLDYKIHDLVQAGLTQKQLSPLIQNHFPEIYKDK